MDIYVDMDEVVADFKGYAEDFFKKTLDQRERLPPEEWSRLASNPRLYRDLKVREGAYDLMTWLANYCRENNCGLYFLTALPRNNDMPYAVMDKVEWCQKYFPSVPCFIGPYSRDKVKRCKTGDILIDDRLSNTSAWLEAGGRAYQYKNWPDCKRWLESILT